MNLQQTSIYTALPESQKQPVLPSSRKRIIESDLLTDDHIRQMLVTIGSNFQADSSNRKKINALTENHRLN
jgi:hypothetical protein